MNRKATPMVSIIVMFLVAVFTMSLAIKQFFVFREQVYQEAFLGIDYK